jgi:uncharacterized membrane protein
MVSRMVDRYVEKVVELLPFWAKRTARRDLKDTIYDMLHDYCEGETPVGRDLRVVLDDLGTPEELADQYYEYRRKLRRRRKINVRKVFRIVQASVMTAAFILVMAGLLLLTLGITNNLTMMLVGGAMAVAVIFARMLMPIPEEPSFRPKQHYSVTSSFRER